MIQFHFPFNVTIQHHMLQKQFVLVQHTLLETREFLLVEYFDRVEVIHELQFLQVERSIVLVFLREHSLFVLEHLVLGDVILH